MFFKVKATSFLLVLSSLLLRIFSTSLFVNSGQLVSCVNVLVVMYTIDFAILYFLIIGGRQNHFGDGKAQVFLEILSVVVYVVLYLTNVAVSKVLCASAMGGTASSSGHRAVVVSDRPNSNR